MPPAAFAPSIPCIPDIPDILEVKAVRNEPARSPISNIIPKLIKPRMAKNIDHLRVESR